MEGLIAGVGCGPACSFFRQESQADTVVLHSLAVGQGEATLTATDPHGEVATGEVVDDVWVPQLVFEDDFATEESLDDWEEPNEWTYPSTADGVLTVTAISDLCGAAVRRVGRVERPCVDFTARAATSEDHPGIAWHTGSRLIYGLDFRRDDRWVLAIWNSSDLGWGRIGRGTSLTAAPSD